MLSAKQGTHWYHFYNVFGMTRPGIDPTSTWAIAAVNNNTTRNDTNSWKVIQASSAHLTNIFEMVNHPVINILMVPESKI